MATFDPFLVAPDAPLVTALLDILAAIDDRMAAEDQGTTTPANYRREFVQMALF